MTTPLRLTLFQTDIAWEEKQTNLSRLHALLETLSGQTDLVVLPETFTTGFTMQPEPFAEPGNGSFATTMRQWSVQYGIALAGSYIASAPLTNDAGKIACFNRAFFFTPEGGEHYADKRHLFRMGGEDRHYTPGHQREIIYYRGWNIRLLVCYDLRFPVWSRNVGNAYDLLIYVANWPASRRRVWDVLLQARAIENQSYTCGVNRIGIDGHGFDYNGGSALYSPKGDCVAAIADNKEDFITIALDHASLALFREKFPVWKDADRFTLEGSSQQEQR